MTPTFVHPHVLWLLPVAAALGWWTSWPVRRLAGGRRMTLAISRMACLIAAVLALSRPVLPGRDSRFTRVAVIELSTAITDGSIREIIDQWKADSAAPFDHVVAFSNRASAIADLEDLTSPERRMKLRQELAVPLFNDETSGGAAIEDAIQLAGALIPPGHAGEVVLYTTGLQTRGDAAAEALRLHKRKITLVPRPLTPHVDAAFLITSVTAPATAAVGETVSVQVSLAARPTTRLSIAVEESGSLLAGVQDIDVIPTGRTVMIPVPVQRPGLVRFDIHASDAAGTERQSAVSCRVTPPKEVLVLEGAAASPLTAALSRMLGLAAHVRGITSEQAAQMGSGDLDGADLLVVGDVAAASVPAPLHNAIRRRVERGGSLLFVGGQNTYGADGWTSSTLADVLPVTSAQRLERPDPTATVVFIIDTSGSMASSRLDLAKEVARLALRRLQQQDKAGIVEFYGAKRWAAPIQSAANRLDLHRALNRLSAGGGTEIYPALEEASYALRDVNTRTRHVIIISDGGVESAPFESLIRRMSDAGQTVSCVVIGSDPGPLMEQMAQWGGGRFYRVTDRLAIPEILLHRPGTELRPSVVRDPSRLVPGDIDDVTRGIDLGELPALATYYRVTAKATADVLVRSGQGDPVVVRWQHGLGRVAIVATQIGSDWMAQTAVHPAAATLVSNLCRSLYSLSDAAHLSVEPIVGPAGAEIYVQQTALANNVADISSMSIEVVTAAGLPVLQLTTDPVRLGIWDTLLQGLNPGYYEVRVRTARGGAAAVALTVPALSVARGYQPDRALLNQLGSAIPIGIQNAADAKIQSTDFVEITGPLVLVSIIGLLVNVLVRRLPATVASPRRPTLSVVLLVSMIVACGNVAAVAAPATKPAATRTVDKPAGVAPDELIRLTTEVEDKVRGPTAGADDWSLLASLRDIRGDASGAIEAIEKALALKGRAPEAEELRIRLAILRAEQGATDAWVATDVAPRTNGLTLAAAAYGRADAAVAFLPAPHDAFDRLLRASVFLSSGVPAAAQEEFAAALRQTAQPYDRRFIVERLAATSQEAGTFPAMLDVWLRDPSPRPEQLVLAAAALRDAGRVDELIALWRRLPSDSFKGDVASGARFMEEVLGAAAESGRSEQAEAVARSGWEANPADPQRMAALTRLLLDAGRFTDADAVVTTAAHRAPTVKAALAIARTAVELGRYDAALQIATKAEGESTAAAERVDAALFVADVECQRFHIEIAIVHLRHAAELAGNDPRQLARVADAHERAGDPAGAITIYEQIRPAGDSARRRLAWLYREAGRTTEAEGVLREMAQTATTPALRKEAQLQLLDFASRRGAIGDLAAELEERLKAGRASSADVELLVEIYVGLGDAVAASEVVAMAGGVIGGPSEVLRRQADVYLRCSRFGLADRALRQLLVSDPRRAVDTLQQIAVVAIERGRADEANAALVDIERRTGAGNAMAEFRAGILAQLGQHARASEEYSRAIAERPQQAEYWILWANEMKQAGRQAEAVQRLLLLAARATDDEQFAVAVDGLLNLQAPRESLRVARRFALSRLCSAGGHRLLHYELVRELCDATGDAAMSGRIGELSLLIAGEQRVPLLRELINLATTARQTERALSYQRTLLALGDHVPPQVFLDIGRQLLTDGRIDEAARAFRRAQATADDDATSRQVALLYERAGRLDAARRTLDPLVQRTPNDIDLRVRAGNLCEQIGDFPAAIAHYQSAIELIVQKGDVGPGLRPPAPFDEALSKSISDAERHLDAVIRGLLSAARSPAEQSRVAEWATSLARDRIARAPKATASVDPVSADLARLVRRIAFPLHRPDLPETLDAALAWSCPADRKFADAITADRSHWGLTAPSVVPAGTSYTPDDAAALIPRLILHSDFSAARTTLAATTRVVPTKADTYPLLVSSAIALDDADSTASWARTWFSTALRTFSDRGDPGELARCVRATWGVLAPGDRQSFLSQIREQFDRASRPARARLAPLIVQVSLAMDEAPARRIPHALAAAAQIPGAQALATLVAAVPDDQQGAVIETACRPLPPDRRRGLLLQLAVTLESPLSPAGLAAFKSAFPATVTTAVDPAGPGFGQYDPGDAAFVPESWQAIAAVLAASGGAASSDRILAARAFSLGRDADSASEQAIAVFHAAISNDAPANVKSMAAAAHALSSDAAEKLLQSIDATTPNGAACAAVLADRLGRWDDATRLYRSAFSARPDNVSVRGELVSRLRGDLRWAELEEAFAPYLADTVVVDAAVRSNLATARRHLAWTSEADFTAFSFYSARLPTTAPSAPRISQADRELARFRAYQMLLRERRQYTAVLAQTPFRVGGLAEYDMTAAGRETIYQALANHPWAVDEFAAALRSTLPGSQEVDALVAGLASVPADRQRQLRNWLEEGARAGTLTVNDRTLLVALIRAGYHPPPFAADAVRRAVDDVSPLDLAQTLRVAKALDAIGDASGRKAVQRWVDAAARVLPYATAAPRWNPAVRPDDIPAAPGAAPPTAEPDDAMESARLATLATADLASARAALLAERRSGIVPAITHPRTAMVAARLAAEAGDFPAFRQEVGRAVNAWLATSYQRVPDVTLAMPARAEAGAPAVSAACEVLADRALAVPADRRDMARAAALLARWSAMRSLSTEANHCVALAAQLAPEQGEHTLWIADALLAIGRREDAGRLERALFHAGRLPLMRLAEWAEQPSASRPQTSATAPAGASD